MNAIKSSAPNQAPSLKTPLQRFLQPVKDLAREMWKDGVEPDLEEVVRVSSLRSSVNAGLEKLAEAVSRYRGNRQTSSGKSS